MTDPAAPHPEDPTPAAPQVEANPTAPQASHPTSPRTPQLENLNSSTAQEVGHPAKPRTPWAESTPSPAAPQSGHSTNPATAQAETRTGPLPQASPTNNPLTPQSEIPSSTPPGKPVTPQSEIPIPAPPGRPVTPQADAPTNPSRPPAGHFTDPITPQVETSTDPTPPASHIANPLVPHADGSTAQQTDYSHAPQFENPTDPLAQLAERIEDLTRVIVRQATTIERLADEAKARDRRDRAGADLPLVLELFALHTDAAACATTAESPRERAAFEAIATRIERLIVGRGGTLVIPQPGDTFDALTMEAADVAKTDDPALDRTVASVAQTGLTVSGRSVRPAGVVVHRHH
ncbi:nucleotide exchange factor GrpE [Nocardia anaemiae]|uniref:nucleotide exchange factor GrpE n=1 Tax=Nocardia anaemiae TaxID=263910 RepID=UPI000AE61578|nr:nucleotide exchange factor GrpE [Nocardia anaemiae]